MQSRRQSWPSIPGLGRSLGLDAIVLQLFEALPLPLVLDADRLNAAAARLDRAGRPSGPRVLLRIQESLSGFSG